MEGYDVVTNDDHKVGHVAGREGSYLIVEHGTILKKKHPVPDSLAHVDEGEQVVRLTISKGIFQDGPTLDDGSVNKAAVAEYYGVAEGHPAPETHGLGDLAPEDPARTAEQDSRAHGLEPPEQQRARVRDSMRPEGE